MKINSIILITMLSIIICLTIGCANNSKKEDLKELRKTYALADKKINTVYKELTSKLTPEKISELKIAQTTWFIEKSQCNTKNNEVQRLNCLISKTHERVEELKK